MVAHKNRFLPLLSDIPQHFPLSTNESTISTAPKSLNEKQLDLSNSEHATRHKFIPLLSVGGTNSPKGRFPSTGSFSPRSPSASALNIEQPSQEQREHVAEAAAQAKTVRLSQSKSVRRYEWPLIINGVYQGDGPLPSCRIEDKESQNEPRPYSWPLIVLHRASSAEDGDQQPGPNGKEANENAAAREDKVEGIKTDDKSTEK